MDTTPQAEAPSTFLHDVTVVFLWGLGIVAGLILGTSLLDMLFRRIIKEKPAHLLAVQLLTVNAPELQAAIHRIAVSADADQPGKLTGMFREAVQVTLDARGKWVYGRAEVLTGKREELDTRLERKAVDARAAFTSETTKNQQDGELRGPTLNASTAHPETGAPLYLAVTLGAVISGPSPAVPDGTSTTATVEEVLRHLLHLDSKDIHEVQVVWSPDVPGEFLTEDQAIRKYPDLGKL